MNCTFVLGPTPITPVSCARGRNAWRSILATVFTWTLCRALPGETRTVSATPRRRQFEPTDGTGYREWFNGKTDVTNGHLKTVTRLLKYMRNHKGSFDVPSVVLTTLIGHSVHYNERGKRFKDSPETLKTVSNRMNAFLQATQRMPRFRNPARRSERFDKGWDQAQYRNFQENFQAYNNRINDAFEESNRHASIQKWQRLFGSGFG